MYRRLLLSCRIIFTLNLFLCISALLVSTTEIYFCQYLLQIKRYLVRHCHLSFEGDNLFNDWGRQLCTILSRQYFVSRSQMAIMSNHLAKILSFFEGQVISGPLAVTTFNVMWGIVFSLIFVFEAKTICRSRDQPRIKCPKKSYLPYWLLITKLPSS